MGSDGERGDASVQPVIWVAVPVYNNRQTVRQVVEGIIAKGLPVVVVDDGSTDGSGEGLDGLEITLRRHPSNRGKGAALMTAARAIRDAGGTHMICFDADGQFDPEDLDTFVQTIHEHPLGIAYGVRKFGPDAPGTSVFGRRFSNFWARLTTGKRVRDSQCGFRAYPIGILLDLNVRKRHYDFEVEVLVRASWAGVKLHGVPVEVTYSPPGGRVTHFRLFTDNARISRSYTRLVLRAMLPMPHKMVKSGPHGVQGQVLSPWHPIAFLKALLTENSAPWELAAAVALGLFIATLPIFGLHSVSIIFIATYCRLNRFLAFSVSHLCAPPVVPAFCLEVGYFMRHGTWLSEFNAETLWSQLGDRFLDYVLGSLVVAPVLAALGGVVTFGLAVVARAINNREELAAAAPPKRGITAKYGSRWGISFFHLAMRVVGLRGAYFFLWFAVPFYFVRPAVRASMRPYIRHRFPAAGRLRRTMAAFRLLMEFARSMVDQAAAMARGPGFFAVDVIRQEELKTTLDSGRGVVLLTTHAGNWKTVISTLDITDTQVHLLLFRDPTSPASGPHGVPEILGAAKIIDPDSAFGGLIQATSALEAGEIVSIMGDRHWGGRSVAVEFLGGRALVPESPYRLARSTGARVCAIFVARTGFRRFCVEFHELAEVDEQASSRSEIAARQAQQYADLVEDFVMRHPYSWFNFFDFWRPPEGGAGGRE